MQGLYIHFPYCLRKCPYCDFAVAVVPDVPGARYARAVGRELELRLAQFPSFRGPLSSVYLGGGTPSLWAVEEVHRVLESVRTALSLEPSAEVTLEANPEALSLAQLQGYREAGVNRLSLGAQSFASRPLALLGRAHGPEQVVQAVELARQARFGNLSLDVIYGVPGQRVEEAEEDARHALALGPEHLSTYALTLERDVLAVDVPLARAVRRGDLALPPDEDVVEMADRIEALAEAKGLRSYEVSSLAKPGFESRHNRLYWTGGEYLALGCGAVGFVQESPA